MATEDLRYPIGRFRSLARVTIDQREMAIGALAELPSQMRAAVAGLADTQLDTPYRPGGWTVRQVVHHVADSHINAYVRLKLALTEDGPAITAYDENAWALLADVALPVGVSLALLDALHMRWVALARAAAPDQFDRWFIHPELGTRVSLDAQLQMYAWHSRHHVAHVTALRQRNGW